MKIAQTFSLVDYRRLSALRDNFNAKKMAFLKSDIPIMALTATATTRVREDILKSLHMSEDPVIVLTSFFRPNLRFSVTSFYSSLYMLCLFFLFPKHVSLLSNQAPSHVHLSVGICMS